MGLSRMSVTSAVPVTPVDRRAEATKAATSPAKGAGHIETLLPERDKERGKSTN